MNHQLSLFEIEAIEKAGRLLDLLNEGSKEPYQPQYHFWHNGYLVFMAAKKKKEIVFNVLDKFGNIPEGFSVNWRNLEHIKQEIGL